MSTVVSAGVMIGAERIPATWTAPLNDELRSALSGHASLSLRDLARRTVAVVAG